MTEYPLYVGIKEEYTMNFDDTLSNNIKTNSLLCGNIIFTAVDSDKKYLTIVSSSSTATMPFTIRATADNGTTKDYPVKLFMDGLGLSIVFTDDILELGKGENNLSSLSFVNLAGFVMMPTANTKASFDALF